MTRFKTFEEAASAVDEMFEATKAEGEDSGDESGDDDEDRPKIDDKEENPQNEESVCMLQSINYSCTDTYPNRRKTDQPLQITSFSLTRRNI